MKKINFKKIKMEVEIDNFQGQDLSTQIGNLLFKQASTLTMDELSRKIFKSKGEIEISDEDFSQMIDLLKDIVVYRVITAIENSAIDSVK